MKKLIVSMILSAGLCMAGDPLPPPSPPATPITDAQRLAVEKARREAYRLQLLQYQLRDQLASVQKEVSDLFGSMVKACYGTLDPDSLVCTPKPPTTPTEDDN